jgi:hypothetical protein
MTNPKDATKDTPVKTEKTKPAEPVIAQNSAPPGKIGFTRGIRRPSRSELMGAGRPVLGRTTGLR